MIRIDNCASDSERLCKGTTHAKSWTPLSPSDRRRGSTKLKRLCKGTTHAKSWPWHKDSGGGQRRCLFVSKDVDVCLFSLLLPHVQTIHPAYRCPSSTSRLDTMPGWYPGIAHQVRLNQCMGGPRALLSGTNVGRPRASKGQVLWCAALH